MIPLDGSGIDRLTSYIVERNPDIEECSLDGTYVIYGDYSSTPKRLVRLDLFTGEEKQNVLPDTAEDVCMSPDQTQFCYVLGLGMEDCVYHLYTGTFEPEPNAVETELQEAFALNGNYPNPFNLSTTIRFTLPSPGHAELEIYNITGQKIRRLVSDTREAGVHNVVWDGKNENGQTVSSGVYIARLMMGNNVVTKNMMMVK